MQKKITYWQDGKFFIGYSNDYPEYMTQAYSIEELIENIKEIILEIEQEKVPGKRQTLEITI